MIYEFEIPMKPFSINAYTYSDKRHKTAEARAWDAEFLSHLEEHKMLHDLAMDIKAGATVGITIVCEWPVHVFYNKAGTVSAKTMDISNCEKIIIDRLFKDFMAVDDRFITTMTSSKKPGPRHMIKIRLELNPL